MELVRRRRQDVRTLERVSEDERGFAPNRNIHNISEK